MGEDKDELQDLLMDYLDEEPPPLTFYQDSKVSNLVTKLLGRAVEVVKAEPVFLELEPPFFVAGSVHGHFEELRYLFQIGEWPPKGRWLFLGNYIDRGEQSLDCILLLLILKVMYPKSVYLLRGNHEIKSINETYGFNTLIKERGLGVWCFNRLNEVFDFLPMAARINGQIFCVHSGISPNMTIQQIKALQRPLSIGSQGLACDMLWADPTNAVKTWCKNDRGFSYGFGNEVIDEFCNSNDIDLIVRSHQLVDGFIFNNPRFVSIFSAPFFCRKFSNKAAVLYVGKKMQCRFAAFRLHPETVKEAVYRKTASLRKGKQAEAWKIGGWDKKFPDPLRTKQKKKTASAKSGKSLKKSEKSHRRSDDQNQNNQSQQQ